MATPTRGWPFGFLRISKYVRVLLGRKWKYWGGPAACVRLSKHAFGRSCPRRRESFLFANFTGEPDG